MKERERERKSRRQIYYSPSFLADTIGFFTFLILILNIIINLESFLIKNLLKQSIFVKLF